LALRSTPRVPVKLSADQGGVTTPERIIQDEESSALVGNGNGFAFTFAKIRCQRQQRQRRRGYNVDPRECCYVRNVVGSGFTGRQFLDDALGYQNLRVQSRQEVEPAELVQIQ
jgi:hypothetical protein